MDGKTVQRPPYLRLTRSLLQAITRSSWSTTRKPATQRYSSHGRLSPLACVTFPPITGKESISATVHLPAHRQWCATTVPFSYSPFLENLPRIQSASHTRITSQYAGRGGPTLGRVTIASRSLQTMVCGSI